MTDTIAAIATAQGQAALGIIRISGPDAKTVLKTVVPKTKAISHPRKMSFGLARTQDTGAVIDEVMCFYAPGPKTATGEDVAEIHGHGGPLVLKALLTQALKAGARMATPGEFTSRGFQNGRLDLTQAEAIMSLIGARSDRAAKAAVRQLSGSIGHGLNAEYDALTRIAAELEAGLDFPDEDLPLEQSEQLAAKLGEIIIKLVDAKHSYDLGSKLTDGATVVIAGPSNAGKSSLLNRLVHEDKALVDAEPGTTRDIVEARGEIDGIPVVFLDTAGLREHAERLEQQGIQKSKTAAIGADLLLLVVDGTDDAPFTDTIIHQLVEETTAPVVLVHNKMDLDGFKRHSFTHFNPSQEIDISAKTGSNINSLEAQMASLLSGDPVTSEVMLTTVRQLNVVESTIQYAKQGLAVLLEGETPELAATDLRSAREALASLWGKHAQEEVIDTIFSSFCLGK